MVAIQDKAFDYRFYQWHHFTTAILQNPNLFAFWITKAPTPEIINLKNLLQNYKVISQQFFTPGLFSNYNIQQKNYLKNFYLNKNNKKYINDNKFMEVRPNLKILFNNAEYVEKHLHEMLYFDTPLLGTTNLNIKYNGEFPLFLNYTLNLDFLNFIFKLIGTKLQKKTYTLKQNLALKLFENLKIAWQILIPEIILNNNIPKNRIEKKIQQHKWKNKNKDKALMNFKDIIYDPETLPFTINWAASTLKITSFISKDNEQNDYDDTTDFFELNDAALKKLVCWKSKRIYQKILRKKKTNNKLNFLFKQKKYIVILNQLSKKQRNVIPENLLSADQTFKELKINNYIFTWGWKKNKIIIQENIQKKKKEKFKFFFKNMHNLKYIQGQHFLNNVVHEIDLNNIFKKYLKTTASIPQPWSKIFNVFFLLLKKKTPLFNVFWRTNKNWIKKKEKIIKKTLFRQKKVMSMTKNLTPIKFFSFKKNLIL